MAIGSSIYHYQQQVEVMETSAVAERNTRVGHILSKLQNNRKHQNPTMSKKPHCIVSALIQAKAKEVNPERKSRVMSLRRICDQTDTFPPASAAEMLPKALGFFSFKVYRQCRERDPDAWSTQVPHIIFPGLRLAETTPVSTHGVDATR